MCLHLTLNHLGTFCQNITLPKWGVVILLSLNKVSMEILMNTLYSCVLICRICVAAIQVALGISAHDHGYYYCFVLFGVLWQMKSSLYVVKVIFKTIYICKHACLLMFHYSDAICEAVS